MSESTATSTFDTLEAAVVLWLAVDDRGVQIETDEHALFGWEVVERIERGGGGGFGHTSLSGSVVR